MKLDQELSTKLSEMQSTNNQQILDSLMNCINLINAGKKYDFIFNAADVLVGDEAHNLTGEVLKNSTNATQKKHRNN
jgi:outer membrane protein